MAAPAMDTPAYTPIARFRSLPSGKVTAISDSEAVGAEGPAPAFLSPAVKGRARAGGDPAAQRRHRKQRDARHEDPAPSEQVTHAPAEQQQTAEGERISVDNP